MSMNELESEVVSMELGLVYASYQYRVLPHESDGSPSSISMIPGFGRTWQDAKDERVLSFHRECVTPFEGWPQRLVCYLETWSKSQLHTPDANYSPQENLLETTV